jgi:hypothetical protein
VADGVGGVDTGFDPAKAARRAVAEAVVFVRDSSAVSTQHSAFSVGRTGFGGRRKKTWRCESCVV